MNYSIEIELKKIGKKIKEIRLAKRMTQSALASSSDVDIRSIQLIEVGKLNMSLKIFFAISHSLEIKPSDLLNKIEMDDKFHLK